MKENILISAVIVLFLNFSNSVISYGQLSEESKKVTPELPGEIVVDFGFNLATDEPEQMNFNWFRSKSLGIQFIHPFEIGEKMSFRVGLGVGLEKLGTKDGFTINYVDDENGNTVLAFDTIPGSTTKSQLALNFLELPIEFRYNFGGNDGRGGFYIGAGGSFGYMVDGHTKVKYEYNGRKNKIMRYDDYRFNKTRLGVQGRIGFRGFGLFYKYYFSDVFNAGSPAGTENTAYSTIGISVAGF